MNWKLWLLAVTLIGMVVAGLLLRVEEDESFELTILHTNDIHAHYDSFEPWGEPVQGGVARLKTAIDTEREGADYVLVLDAGDQFQGTLFFTVGGAQVVADVMNGLKYDVMCIGNHEFDAGPSELATFIDLAEFFVLSANTDAFADLYLSGKIEPYSLHLFEDGQPVAVIGLTTEHTAIASSPGPNVQFLDVTSTAQRTVDELEERGIDVIVALTHLGYERDLELAHSVDGIDVIVGGHSHTLLDSYPTITTSASGEPVLVVTAHEWGKRLGRLDVAFTDDGFIGSYTGRTLFIDESIPEDEGMLDVLAGYRPAIEALMTRVVGATDVDLNGAREDIRVRETNLANLICDAMLWKTGGLDATIAIQNGGGIRASIPVGEITMGQVLEVLPYGNQISVLSLVGAELIEALENGVSQVEDGSGAFPHVGGMRYTFDPTAELGGRIASVEVWDEVSEAFVDLDADATYTLATNNFLANGGDGYEVFAQASDRYDSGWLLSDTLAEFLAEQGPVAPEVEGRISESP
jgi:5'-nucleotidase/UDP-sugar diphosphatase